MQRSIERKPIAQARPAVFAGLALLVSGTALAQVQPVYTCDSDITMNAASEAPYYINEPIPIVITLGPADVSNGTEDGVLSISSFDYKPDCEPGSDFETCSAAGNNVELITADVDIGGSCGVAFTTDDTSVPGTIQFTPATPIELVPNAGDGEQETCTVEFEIMVVSVDPGTTGILEWGGWTESQAVCSYPNDGAPTDLGAAASGSLFFPLSTERVTFRVTKDFTDDALDTATVRIRCNAGLPLEQEFDLSDNEYVTFVSRAFTAGQMDCIVFEDPIEGYTPSYSVGDTGVAAQIYDDENGCHFEGIQSGDFTCDISNNYDDVAIEVTKEWFGVEDVDFPLVAEATYTCFDVYTTPNGTVPVDVTGTLTFNGETSTRVIGGLYPIAGRSYCEVTEVNVPSVVEADSSDCARVPVIPGADCTLVNTLFYEGIPTLSQYGQALMALLMLGIGFVGLRRFV